MTNHLIEKSEWKDYFDLVTKLARGQRVTIEAVGPEVGDQFEEVSVFFEGVDYSPDENILRFYTDDLEHTISEPSKIMTLEDGAMIKAILVKCSEVNQIIQFGLPLMIPE